MERLADKIREYLATCEGRNVNLKDIRTFLKIEPGSKDDQNLRTWMCTTGIKKRIVSPSGRSDGIYKVIRKVEPVEWWRGETQEPLNFQFPKDYKLRTKFGLEDYIEVFEGDLILVTGASNYGKTALVINILAENLNSFECVLMGSEYTAADGKISPKFKRRLENMSWANWMNGGSPRFTLLPVSEDFPDYIKPDCLNVIDWITLPGEYYLIDHVLKTSKDRIGKGVLVAVLQKHKGAEYGEGGERTERYADVYLKIDPFGESESLLTIGKVKSPKGKIFNRGWVFSVVDSGANIYNIREVKKCDNCFGKGWRHGVPCSACDKLGWIEKGAIKIDDAWEL